MEVNSPKSKSSLEIGEVGALVFFKMFNRLLKKNELAEYRLKGDTLINSQFLEKYLKKQQTDLGNKQNQDTREKIQNQYWTKVNRFRWLFSIIPFLKMIAVCNTLAMQTVDHNSDVDLLVITSKNRLFTSRLLISFWLQIFGVRRHGSKIAGRFCLSFYLTENNLNLENLQIKPFDIYLAYWLKTLQPLLGQETYEKLLQSNQNWLKKYFERPLKKNLSHLWPANPIWQKLKKIQEKILAKQFGDWLENIFKNWQISRAKRKQTNLTKQASVIVSDTMLKFHNLDQRQKFYENWKKDMEKLNLPVDF